MPLRALFWSEKERGWMFVVEEAGERKVSVLRLRADAVRGREWMEA